MPTLRLKGSSSVTSAPSMNTSPSSGTAKPATHASVVVFPDPDGPSSVRSSPARAVKLTPSTARVAPKVFTRPSRRTSPPRDGRELGPRAAIGALQTIEDPFPGHDDLEDGPSPPVERDRPEQCVRENVAATLQTISKELSHEGRHGDASAVVPER